MRTFIIKQSGAEAIRTSIIDADGFNKCEEDPAAVIFYIKQNFAGSVAVGLFYNVEEITSTEIIELDE